MHLSKLREQPLTAQYLQLLLRLVVALLLLTLARVLFYYYNRDLLQIDSSSQLLRLFRGGLRFDLSALGYGNLLVVLLSLLPLPWVHKRWYQRSIAVLYIVVNSLMWVLNLGDMVYYRFTQTRTTMAVFTEFAGDDKLHFLRFFVDYWPVTLVGLLGIAALICLERFLPRPVAKPSLRGIIYYPLNIGSLCLLAWLGVAAMRGGFTHEIRPITLSNASAYVDKPQQRAMVLNTPFALIRSFGKRKIPTYQYMPEAEALAEFDPVTRPEPTPVSGMMRGRNVMVIIWESFAREWVGGLNRDKPGYRGYTPFIDSLLGQSYVFTDAYANGYKSIESMPSIFTSILRPEVPLVTSIYSGYKLPTILPLFQKLGYHTAFFHGAMTGSMGFDAFTNQIGFEKYFGREDYGNDKDYDGIWGIWDEPFLQYVGRQLGKLPEPFFATEFTLSSHHPFRVPKQYESVLPKGTYQMHQPIGYTDMALKRFFDYARTQPWYERTLFVLVADHAVAGVRSEYKTSVGAFRIPIILFDPQGRLKGQSAETVSQMDLGPTLLDLVGNTAPFVSFGNNAFDPSRPHVAITPASGYQMIQSPWVLQYDGQRIIGLYRTDTDPGLQRNVAEANPEVRDRMLRYLQAWLQSYSSRLNENRLTELKP